MKLFQDALKFFELSDVQTQKFTPSNNRKGSAFTKESLDMEVVNNHGLEPFNGATCQVLPALKLGHSPLLLSLFSLTPKVRKRP